MLPRSLVLLILLCSSCTHSPGAIMDVSSSPEDPAADLSASPDQTEPNQSETVAPITEHGCIFSGNGLLQFLPTSVGETRTLNLALTSCEGKDNRIVSAYLDPPDAPFSLSDAKGTWDPATEPLLVPMYQQVSLEVTFAPETLSPLVDGLPAPLTGELVFEYGIDAPDAPLQTLIVPLSGVAIDGQCITPIIAVETQPQSPMAVRLDGLSSLSPAGPVTGWQWTVEGPEEATAIFHVSDHTATTVFATDVPGPYTVALTVSDNEGTPQCELDTVTVTLDGELFEPVPPVPETGLEVMLLWRTPGDWHQEDGEPVSDVDLHLVHEWAGGPDLDGNGLPDGFFATPYDCWAGNPGPHWGVNEPGSTDDPEFFGDGEPEGPEQILLVNPEAINYRVGVHYADDNGLGPVFARTVVYLHGQLTLQTEETLLVEGDMWEVATIDWPSQTVSPAADDEGNAQITPDYSNPYAQ